MAVDKLNKIIYLPVEIVERELDAKLLLALEALSRGYTVFLGYYWDLPEIAKEVGGGFYLYKAMTDYRAKKLFSPLARCSINSGVLDEEGLIFPSLEHYVRTRIGEGLSLKVLSKVFAWGKPQAEFIEKKYEMNPGGVEVTGNPRFDVLREPYRKIYLERASGIAKRYGDFVLINTNFGPGNYSPKFGISYHEHMRSFGRISTPEEELFYTERTQYYAGLFSQYVDMIRELAKEIYPLKIVLRPHPVENHGRWRDALGDCPNVSVVFQGSAIDWIAASRCLIHTGCTTGVEAFAFGKPVFRYNQNLRLDMESEIPNRVGIGFSSQSELVRAVGDFLSDPQDTPVHVGEGEAYLSQWIDSLTGDYAYKRILDSVDDGRLAETVRQAGRVKLTRRFAFVIARNYMVRMIAYCGRYFPALQAFRFFSRAVQRVQRFPGITREMLETRLTELARLNSDFSREGLRISLVGPDIFRVEKKAQ